MVVKLETVSALYADVYPTIKSRRDMDTIVTDCPRRQKRQVALPALVEDETEEVFETEKRSYLLHTEGLRRQKSVSPQRQRLRRSLALPSLSEDEEPWSSCSDTSGVKLCCQLFVSSSRAVKVSESGKVMLIHPVGVSRDPKTYYNWTQWLQCWMNQCRNYSDVEPKRC